jgi:hypothetical protein
VNDNNEGVSEHFDNQLTMRTSAYENGDNGSMLLTWGILKAKRK